MGKGEPVSPLPNILVTLSSDAKKEGYGSMGCNNIVGGNK